MKGFLSASAMGGPRMNPLASRLVSVARKKRVSISNNEYVDEACWHADLPCDGVNADISISTCKDIHNVLKDLGSSKESTDIVKTGNALEWKVWQELCDRLGFRAVLFVSRRFSRHFNIADVDQRVLFASSG